jgi:hypothetical protein
MATKIDQKVENQSGFRMVHEARLFYIGNNLQKSFLLYKIK